MSAPMSTWWEVSSQVIQEAFSIDAGWVSCPVVHPPMARKHNSPSCIFAFVLLTGASIPNGCMSSIILGPLSAFVSISATCWLDCFGDQFFR